MIWFVGRRFVAAIVTLFLASIVISLVIHLAPGDPATVIAGPDATPAVVATIRHNLGLDRPLSTQYVDWMHGIVTGHLGTSYSLGQPISSLVLQRLPSTIELTIGGALFLVVFGLALGIALALRGLAWLRAVVDALATLALSMPAFVTGIVLIYAFAVKFRVLPSGGGAPFFADPVESVRHLVMPSIALALPGVAVVARLLATEMRRVRGEEFVKTAVAKGMPPSRVLLRHVLPNSLGAPLVEIGIRVGQMLGGAIVVEAIFARAGIGSLLIQAVNARDYPLAQDLLLYAIAGVIAVQLISELLAARVDPRIRFDSA